MRAYALLTFACVFAGCGSSTIGGASIDGSVPDAGPLLDVHTTIPSVDAGGSDAVTTPDGTSADVRCTVDCGSGPSAMPSCPDPSERGCGTVTLPGGSFIMGGDLTAVSDIPAAGTITVSGFALDAYEVTVARFRRFWIAGHPAVRSPLHYPGGSLVWTGGFVTEPNFTNGLCTWTESPGVLEAHPITCVDWYTAQAFCAWDGGRLPTEAEWEYAARGWATAGLASGRNYPWGNTDPVMCDRAQWDNCPGDDGTGSKRVGSFAPVAGLYDLAGNVSEWTADWFNTYIDAMCWAATPRTDPVCNDSAGGVHGFRGGAFDSVSDTLLRGASREAAVPDDSNVNAGFRCARAP